MSPVMEEKIIEVNMAQMEISQAPARLVTRGLGSCLGITLYDASRKAGGMSHPMLPDIEKSRIKSNPSRFVNSAIRKMVDELQKQGSSKNQLVAKIFGGAHMFGFIASDSILNVGQKNVEVAQTVLKELGIEIVCQETGGSFGRTIELSLETGKVLVKTVSWGEKEV
ncbi:MAG: chemotaxis protein CheD [Candidatus Omnitrophica bacterium]|nr:chemotaxis protein CheD [Candidatus Omnitrophota bacterium]